MASQKMERKMINIIRILKIILLPLLVLLCIIYLLIFLFLFIIRKYTQKKFDNLKIVCVGNITLGGSGKTEVVRKLIEDIKNAKMYKKVGVISRGYKRKSREFLVLSPQESYPDKYVRKVGDEAFMLFRDLKVPVVVSSDKKKAILELYKRFSSEVIVSDDGFQNFSFHKDINILVLNMLDFKKFKFIFPLGNLREPLFLAVKRADYVILNHTRFILEDLLKKLKAKIKKINKNTKIITANYKIKSFVNLYSKKIYSPLEFLMLYNKINLLCAIANPFVFKKMLMMEGFDIIKEFFKLDHYWYKSKEIIKFCQKNSFPIVITRKDAVRINYYIDEIKKNYMERFFYMDIYLEITEGKQLWQQLINYL